MIKNYIKEPDNCEKDINSGSWITCSKTHRTKTLFLIVQCLSHSKQLSLITDV